MEQTNRTLLLTEINTDVESILTFVNEIEQKHSLTDENIKQIHSKLEVRSFEEFMKKFNPAVYMKLNTDQFEVSFSQRHLGPGEERIPLDDPDSLFTMLVGLIKAKQMKHYVLTSFSDMLYHLIPKESTAPVLRARDEIIYLIKDSQGDNAGKIRSKMRKFMKEYDDGLLLLSAFLQDSVWYAAEQNEPHKKDKAILIEDEDLQVEILKISDRYEKSIVQMEGEERHQFERIFLSTFEELRSKRKVVNNILIQNLFFLPVWISDSDNQMLKDAYTAYSTFYISLIKKYWVVCKPLIENLLGIKEFFDQYQNVDGMKPSLVVANFQIQELLREDNRSRFELYLKSVNDKNDISDAIWFAILPSVATENAGRDKVIRERFQSRREAFTYVERNEVPEVVLALHSLTMHKVITFMSFEMTDSITFSGLVRNGSDWIGSQLLPFEKMSEKDYLVPCYPNFVVISKEEAYLNMGVSLEFDPFHQKFQINKERTLWLNELGIEASYVAAGMFAAAQCPVYLSKYYNRAVNMKLPGIAYRFSEDDHNFITYTNMLSDSALYKEDVLQDLIRNSKGVLFGQVDGHVVLLTDRTYAYGLNNQLLISMVQTSTYVERIIKIETQDFKKNLIRQFFQRRPDSIFSQWMMDNTRYVNSFLKQDEKLDYEIDEVDNSCMLSFSFTDHGFVRYEKVNIFKE